MKPITKASSPSDVAILTRLRVILKEQNPCRIEVDATTGNARCCGVHNGFKPCCTGCRHLGAGGCMVSSVACQFYFCQSAWRNLSAALQEEVRGLLEAYRGELRLRHDGEILGRAEMINNLGHVPYRILR